MPSPSPVVERARPLLGTTVVLAVGGLRESRAHAAIDAAFARIAHIHECMSFQSPESDVSRLNRAASGERVRVDPETYAVLRRVVRVARASGGVFDPTVAGEIVRSGRVPAPEGGRAPDPRARWDDLVLEGGGMVRPRRPLWLDLSGIAKGYAVDRAIAVLAAFGAREACADAGGDLRTFGGERQVALRTGFADEAVAVIRLANGSLASSGGRPDRGNAADGQHRDGLRRAAAAQGRFACVLARTCTVADALTKVVLSLGQDSGTVLARFGAAAHLREADGAWHALGTAAR